MDRQVNGISHRKSVGFTIIVVLLLMAAFGAGYYLAQPRDPHAQHADKAQGTSPSAVEPSSAPGAKEARATIWTCSMHPQIRLPKPGKCPICFMDLIPLESESAGSSGTALTRYSMSDAAKKLAEVETVAVTTQPAKVKVRMLGMVEEDETRIAALTSRVDGRLDEIYVNFTGDKVNKGDPMVTIWSPTLIKSQVELFETERSTDYGEDVIKGAEEKLVQLGLTPEQVRQIREQKKPITSITLRAPISGIVTKRMAFLGQFVKEGTDMYMINDLSHVWVKMDAYETDMPWIRYGQDITFTTPAMPGRTFKGKVLFIDPMLNTKTRSVKIRAEAENADLSLKPGMFVTAELEAEVDSAGRVIKREWAGKYICPVHPSDEPSSEPGECPNSKVQKRPVASFGYTDDPNPSLPLVIPTSAPLLTGKRSVVYVEVPNQAQPTYELREVVLGPRAGDHYVVYDGLKEGERVVTRGNFKIDSAMQILARPSMMNPPEPKGPETTTEQPQEEEIEKIDVPIEFLRQLTNIVKEYGSLKESLVDDKPDEARRRARRINTLIRGVKTDSLKAKAVETWVRLSKSMRKALSSLEKEKDIGEIRTAFAPLSEAFSRLLMSFRHATDGPLYVYHCPMAFDGRGAYWVQASKEIANPYFGRAPVKGQLMLTCGELLEEVPPEPGTPEVTKAPTPAGESTEAHENGSHRQKPEETK